MVCESLTNLGFLSRLYPVLAVFGARLSEGVLGSGWCTEAHFLRLPPCCCVSVVYRKRCLPRPVGGRKAALTDGSNRTQNSSDCTDRRTEEWRTEVKFVLCISEFEFWGEDRKKGVRKRRRGERGEDMASEGGATQTDSRSNNGACEFWVLFLKSAACYWVQGNKIIHRPGLCSFM